MMRAAGGFAERRHSKLVAKTMAEEVLRDVRGSFGVLPETLMRAETLILRIDAVVPARPERTPEPPKFSPRIPGAVPPEPENGRLRPPD